MMSEATGPEGSSETEPAGEQLPHRVLLVADEVFRGRDLAGELDRHLGGRKDEIEVFVITPALAHSALDQELGDVDKPSAEAANRLEFVIGELRGVGFEANGQVGPGDPMVAVGDGLNEFPADEIVLVTHTDGESEHAEKGLWDRLSTDYHPPVTQLRVGRPESDGSASGIVAAEHAPAHRRTEDEVIKETRNFPPVRRLDIFGILIGFIGTVALGMLAVATGNEDAGEISGGAAVVLLMAIGAFLLNVANILGLLFFESVRYTGVWEKFFARTSIIFTSVGLVVALVIWLA